MLTIYKIILKVIYESHLLEGKANRLQTVGLKKKVFLEIIRSRTFGVKINLRQFWQLLGSLYIGYVCMHVCVCMEKYFFHKCKTSTFLIFKLHLAHHFLIYYLLEKLILIQSIQFLFPF